ncbi:MAG: hypothetical protein M3Z09_16995 [Acidobacteriota bacterium]|nr:hypothetical protein [Acidobacteriota bacterium]
MNISKRPILAVVAAALASMAAPAAHAQANPSAAQNQQWTNRPCSDPWVSLGLTSFIYGGTRYPSGAGTTGECDTKLYGGGQWSSFADLVQKMQATRAALASVGASFNSVAKNGVTVVTLSDNTGILGGAVMRGSQVISNDGGSIIAQGGGNLSRNFGQIIAQGGGNYSVQGVAKKTIRLPGGVLTVR